MAAATLFDPENGRHMLQLATRMKEKRLPPHPPTVGAGRLLYSQKSDQPPSPNPELDCGLRQLPGKCKWGRTREAVSAHSKKSVRCHSAQRRSSPTASGQLVGTPHQTAV